MMGSWLSIFQNNFSNLYSSNSFNKNLHASEASPWVENKHELFARACSQQSVTLLVTIYDPIDMEESPFPTVTQGIHPPLVNPHPLNRHHTRRFPLFLFVQRVKKIWEPSGWVPRPHLRALYRIYSREFAFSTCPVFVGFGLHNPQYLVQLLDRWLLSYNVGQDIAHYSIVQYGRVNYSTVQGSTYNMVIELYLLACSAVRVIRHRFCCVLFCTSHAIYTHKYNCN